MTGRLLAAIAAVAALASCRQPPPLGSFSTDAWTKDCEQPIVREDPRDPSTPGPILRDGGPAFARAIRRYRCPPPGWAVYTDGADRVVGLCVDDDTRPLARSQGTFSAVVVHETDRARKLIAAHWGHDRAGVMLKGTEDHCAPQSADVGRGLVRWGASQLSYPQPETIRSQFMCCWEVR